MLDSDLSPAELEAWYRHPDTVAYMARISQEAAVLRQREAEEEERAWREQQRRAQERREQERREQQERAERERKREAQERARQERARFYGLQIRPVTYSRVGEYEFWRTEHRTRRMVHGLASTPTITSNNHSRSSAGCMVDFPIPLLCAHENIGSIGEVISLRRSPKEIYVICALHDDNLAADFAWSLVEQGELKAFSVAAVAGTSKVAGAVMGTRFYAAWQLAEVSLCRAGANPDCRAEIFSHRRKIA